MEAKAVPSGYRQCEEYVCSKTIAYYSGFLYKDRFLCSACTIKMLTNEDKKQMNWSVRNEQ